MSSNLLSKVNAVLSNPVIRTGIKVASPEVGLALEIVRTFSSTQRTRTANEVIKVIDQRLSEHLHMLGDQGISKGFRSELEIRVHELLGTLDAWDKVS